MYSARSSPRRRSRRLRKGGQLLVFVVALALIALDAAGTVDLSWQAVALFAAVLVVVLLEDLEELEVGEFGSIQLRDDLDRAKRRVDSLEKPVERANETDSLEEGGADRSDPAPAGDHPSDLATRLYDLLADDPRYALVQLRVELERALEAVETESATDDSLDDDLAAAHGEVLTVCEAAIHGPDPVDREEALRAIDLGLRVLEHLRCRRASSTRNEGVAESDSSHD